MKIKCPDSTLVPWAMGTCWAVGTCCPEPTSVGMLLSISVQNKHQETVDVHLVSNFKVYVLNTVHFVVELCGSSRMWRPDVWPSLWHAFGKGAMGWEILLSTTWFPHFRCLKSAGYGLISWLTIFCCWRAQNEVYIIPSHLQFTVNV